MAQRTEYVILGGPPYETGANQTSLQTFAELSKTSTTLYVCRQHQSSGLTALLGLRKGGRKATALQPGLFALSSTAHVLVTPRITSMIPTVRPEASRRLALRLVGSALRQAISEIGLTQPNLIAYWWMFPEICRWPIWSRSHFDVVDRHWGYEYITSPRQALRNLELSVATRESCRTTTSVSASIAADLDSAARGHLGVTPIGVVENGVSLDRVNGYLAGQSIPRTSKTAIYVGGWNSRVDVDLLERVVQMRPDWTFTLAGGEPTETLRDASNVRSLGPIAYSDAIRQMASHQVGLVPFANSAYNRASNFLKAYDYLAAGLTVLATPLPSMAVLEQKFPQHVLLADTASEWSSALNKFSLAAPPALTDLHEISSEDRVAKVLFEMRRYEVG